MPDFDMIVIGMGSSALTFLYGALNGEAKAGKFPMNKTKVIGETDIWRGIEGGLKQGEKHGVGQHKDLVSTVMNAHQPRNQNGNQQWLDTSEYVSQQDAMKQKIAEASRLKGYTLDFTKGRVTAVKRLGQEFEVTANLETGNTARFTTTKVIVATGAGSTSIPSGIGARDFIISNHERLRDQSRDFPELIGGAEYLNKVAVSEKIVMIYGGSRTSTWDFNHSYFGTNQSNRTMWVAGSAASFNRADHVKRNETVIAEAKRNKTRYVGTIREIEVLDETNPSRPRLLLHFEKELQGESGEKTGQQSVLVHQLIYATGPDAKMSGGAGTSLMRASARRSSLAGTRPSGSGRTRSGRSWPSAPRIAASGSSARR